MSRAYVAEGDGEEVAPAPRVSSGKANDGTVQGLELLRQKGKTLNALRDPHQGRNRTLRYFLDRPRTAFRIERFPDPKQIPHVRLVGRDKADLQKGLISALESPANALFKLRVGDEVLGSRPADQCRLATLPVEGVPV